MISKFILSIFFLLVSAQAFAQQIKGGEAKKDKNEAEAGKKEVKKEKKEPIKWGLHGIGLSHDLAPYVSAFFFNERRIELGFEGNISNVFFIQAEGGYSRMRSSMAVRTPFTYTNTGTYLRIGFDYNLLHRSLDKQAIFVGGRYGMANFQHSLLVTSDTANFPSIDPQGAAAYWDGTNFIEEKGLTRQWFELTGGLTVNIYRNFYSSVIFRYQFDLGGKDGEIVRAVDVPGLRRTDKSPNLVLNYKILYRLPLGKGR